MIVYRGRSYCAATHCRNAADCDRGVTPEIEAHAKRLGLPICHMDFSRECERYDPDPDSQVPDLFKYLQNADRE